MGPELHKPMTSVSLCIRWPCVTGSATIEPTYPGGVCDSQLVRGDRAEVHTRDGSILLLDHRNLQHTNTGHTQPEFHVYVVW